MPAIQYKQIGDVLLENERLRRRIAELERELAEARGWRDSALYDLHVLSQERD